MNSTCWECLFYTSIFCNVVIHIPHEKKNPVRLKYSDKMLLAPMWEFCPKYGPGKGYFPSRLRQWQSPVITNKHWTLLYFQKKTLEIIMKLVGPEITVTSNFTEIRKQSLDNYFETRLMKRCDVTTFPLKKWKIKCEEEPSVWVKTGHSSVHLHMDHSLWPALNQMTHHQP